MFRFVRAVVIAAAAAWSIQLVAQTPAAPPTATQIAPFVGDWVIRDGGWAPDDVGAVREERRRQVTATIGRKGSPRRRSPASR
jgi:hypothetical protein